MKPMMTGGVQQTLNLRAFWKSAPGLFSSYTVKSEYFTLLHRVWNSVSLTHCECFDHERVLPPERVLREHIFGVLNVRWPMLVFSSGVQCVETPSSLYGSVSKTVIVFGSKKGTFWIWCVCGGPL